MAYEMRETENFPNASLIADGILRWYEAHARTLPWRLGPAARKTGKSPDPYAVWLSEIMLQQTTVATVEPRYQDFLTRWPSVNAMASAPLDDILAQWAGLGYYARARNLHKCATVVAKDYGGVFPDTEEELRKLPGIGAYTAAAIAAISFDRRAVVIDGNIERIVSRLFAIDTPLPAAKKEVKIHAGAIWPQKRSGDFAQGLMDLGALVCKPKTPRCTECPINSQCTAYHRGTSEVFPKKKTKNAKPMRRGAVYALSNRKGEILFERRPEKGLLGGMMGLPGTAWAEAPISDPFKQAPASVKWSHKGAIKHTFTHFYLQLDVYAGPAPKGFRRGGGQRWIAPMTTRLPTVMKKAVELASNKQRV